MSLTSCARAWQGTMILGLAYATAILETGTIAGYPHYAYPSLRVMLVVGSAFYSLFFLVTYPMFHAFWARESTQPVWDVFTNALASCTLVRLCFLTFNRRSFHFVLSASSKERWLTRPFRTTLPKIYFAYESWTAVLGESVYESTSE